MDAGRVIDPDEVRRFEGGMVDSHRITASDRANQVVFLAEALGKNERALYLAAALLSVGLSVYCLARVQAQVELQAQRGQQQATTYALAQSQAAQTYALANQQLARTYQNETDSMRRKFDELKTQARLTELILDDWNVTARRAGLKLKGDYAHGPQGNLDAESFHVNVRKQQPKPPVSHNNPSE